MTKQNSGLKLNSGMSKYCQNTRDEYKRCGVLTVHALHSKWKQYYHENCVCGKQALEFIIFLPEITVFWDNNAHKRDTGFPSRDEELDGSVKNSFPLPTNLMTERILMDEFVPRNLNWLPPIIADREISVASVHEESNGEPISSNLWSWL